MKLTIMERIQRQIRTYKMSRQSQRTKPRRQLYGVRISEDHGETWRIRVFCKDCLDKIEEPTRAVNLGVAGSKQCEGCDALNV